MEYDTVFSHAVIADGTGAALFTGDVGVTGKLIAAIGNPGTLRGKERVDASGLCLSPGFIDFHSHSEWVLPSKDQEKLLMPFLLQGVTTFFGGNCGFSPYPVNSKSIPSVYDTSRFLMDEAFSFQWEGMNGFIAAAKQNKPLINAGLLTGHGSLRAYIKGNDPEPLSEDELARLRDLIRQARTEGSFGVSLGLAYVPGVFADLRELECIFNTAAGEGMIITIHGHTYSWTSPFFDTDDPHNVKDVKLFIDLAERSGAKLHLSHMILKGSVTWPTANMVIDAIEQASQRGVDVTFGAIPYHWGNTLINTLLPKWFLEHFHENIRNAEKVLQLEQEIELLEKAIGRESSDLYLLWGGSDALSPFEGKSFQEISMSTNRRDIETILWIMKESEGRAKILTASYSGKEDEYDAPMEMLCSHPLCIMEIDSIVTSAEGPQSPGAYGAFPRVLGRFCRDRGLFPLETAVHKLTGMPAARMGLRDRGVISPGSIADLVLFDPALIAERGTVEDPCRPPAGIHGVWLDGKRVLEESNVVPHHGGGSILRYGSMN